jgi:hypothetical protein
MPPYYTDTDPEIEALQVQLLRSVPAWQKMKMLAGLNASARALAMAGIRKRYPHESEVELRRRLADLLLGPELAQNVYGAQKDDG